MMDDNAADFRIDWLRDDDGHEFTGFTDEYRAIVMEDETRKREAFEAYQRSFSDDAVTGPDACRVCNGEGHIVEASEPYRGRELIPCFACAGSGGRASITPEVADYTGQMLTQMLGRVT
ncbi:hypothetical protein SAMN04489859_100888 [Paracoccus alcaliphilus]|uniref:Uncharacterized protein n=1 Tax=Paracoccus alcaliphilus TaxID=34002 RepID=A0A1H8H2I7_9RHOB|nr:hypothetical protein [Paracoccus alcaliphilus]WCR17406.1 hypothetical protein JHW40_13795 [Paracoccus alcaliphilus]SEN50453.1 hypothetical protein SAMN04489859_100888 [Paracoccus alcaliphilus]